MAASDCAPYYRPLTAATWRASTVSSDRVLPTWPGKTPDAASWQSWLAEVWATRSLNEAVTLASPILAGRIEHSLSERDSVTADLRHMATSLARYLIRLRGRATPFGTFAGVGPLGFGDRTRLYWRC
ncbi:lantibiotic dehydratase, partial [Streptomyces sp. NPDC054784]